MSDENTPQGNDGPRRRGKWVLWGFLAVAAYFLWTEHQAHVVQYLPFALLLACPLMHLFHHGGHGNRESGRGDDENKARPDSLHRHKPQ